MENVAKKIAQFKAKFESIMIASLSSKNQVICSNAPLLQSNLGNFICISKSAEHFDSISTNPNNIEVMFIEDEQNANILARKRLKYRANAVYLPKSSQIFDQVFAEFEAMDEMYSVIKNMADFHIFKLEFGKGRAVFGFGQAYDIDGDIITKAIANHRKKVKI